MVRKCHEYQKKQSKIIYVSTIIKRFRYNLLHLNYKTLNIFMKNFLLLSLLFTISNADNNVTVAVQLAICENNSKMYITIITALAGALSYYIKRNHDNVKENAEYKAFVAFNKEITTTQAAIENLLGKKK